MRTEPLNFNYMSIPANYDTGVLLVRGGIAFLYLYAAYMNSRNKASMQWTIENTKPLFVNTRFANNIAFNTRCAYLGIISMYAGGISILLGIEGRLGALLLALFTVGGTIIHRRQQMEMQKVALENANEMKIAGPAWSAFAAHFANILKNVALILIMIFLVLCGTGKYQVSDITSRIFAN